MTRQEMQELACIALIGLDGKLGEPAFAGQCAQPSLARGGEVGAGRDEEFLRGHVAPTLRQLG